MDKTHLNQEELAERWSINSRTLANWRSGGIGPKFLKLNGRILYRMSDIKDYEDKCLRKSTSESAVEESAA